MGGGGGRGGSLVHVLARCWTRLLLPLPGLEAVCGTGKGAYPTHKQASYWLTYQNRWLQQSSLPRSFTSSRQMPHTSSGLDAIVRNAVEKLPGTLPGL